MKTFRSRRGSALVFTLLVVAVMGLVAAGWLAVISARAGFVERAQAAIERRIALENSKALAQEFMLERVLVSTSTEPFTCSLEPAALGGISVPAWSQSALRSFEKAAGVNHFNPGNGDGYKISLSIGLSDGAATSTRTYHAKSRSPLLAGTLLSLQKPAAPPLAAGAFDVEGAAFVWVPSLSMAFTPRLSSVPDGAAAITFVNSAGQTILPNNLALPRQIADPRVSGGIYDGEFDAIDNAQPNARSSAAIALSGGITVNGATVDSDPGDGVLCDGEGHVTIRLDVRGLPNVRLVDGVRTLTLDGQSVDGDLSADDRPALLVVAESADLTRITLAHHNNRRLVLAVKSPAVAAELPVEFTQSSAVWRLLLEAENTPIALAAPGTATIRGGIRTDRNISLAGRATLQPEADPKNLERLATRTAWIESFAP